MLQYVIGYEHLKIECEKIMKQINYWKLSSIILLLISISWGAFNYYENKEAGLQSAEVIQELRVAMPKGKLVTANQPIINQEKEMPKQKIDDYWYIGEIRIESLGIELPVMDQWDYDRLKISPSRYQGNYFNHNLIIAGHNYQTHFGPLLYINKGALVEIIDVNGNVYRYEVVDMQELKPTELSKLVQRETQDWDLTLFTCTSSTLARQIVRCRQIDSDI